MPARKIEFSGGFQSGMEDIPAIVETLKAAADAYYNGKSLIMDDDTYDALQNRLRELDPENPALAAIGAPPVGRVETLPFPMPSLDKIKPGQDSLNRFLAGSDFVLSEKLDGLSALWSPLTRKLYLRGNGIEGQDISHLIGIQGLLGSHMSEAVVRGELVVPRSTVTTLARSWVNGVIHRDVITPDVAKIRFVAYDVLKPAGLTRSQQFNWLVANGYEVPWWSTANRLTVEDLKTHLLTRRGMSVYDTDGIVVGLDRVPVRPQAGKNPKDAVAFKMPLMEQSAETVVRAVIWAPSSQGYLIPKLEFDPVIVGGATIQFCSAHTARHIVHNRLGPGAKIVIRRSGDVIPTIDRVLIGVEPQLPTGAWEWVDEVHIRTLGSSPALVAAKLHHFLKSLDIPGSGPATAAALVEAGLNTPKPLLKTVAARLSEILGPKTGQTFHTGLHAAIKKASEQDLMIASSTMPRGVGETKLKAIFALEPDIRRWNTNLKPVGWSALAFEEFMKELPAYVTWRTTELASVAYPILKKVEPSKEIHICFTGFRDKALEELITPLGFVVGSLTSKTTTLVVPDGAVKETDKVKVAREKGIAVQTRSAFVAQYLPKE
jgi:DNA ligase (NAD+)